MGSIKFLELLRLVHSCRVCPIPLTCCPFLQDVFVQVPPFLFSLLPLSPLFLPSPLLLLLLLPAPPPRPLRGDRRCLEANRLVFSTLVPHFLFYLLAPRFSHLRHCCRQLVLGLAPKGVEANLCRGWPPNATVYWRKIGVGWTQIRHGPF